MDRFVTGENIRHFRSELEKGVDGPRRAILLQLMVEEENYLGLTHEQLQKLDRHIARLSKIMARQVELIDNPKSLEIAYRAGRTDSGDHDLMGAYIGIATESPQCLRSQSIASAGQ